MQHLLKPVLRCYSDTSEACRTQAVRLLSLLLARFRPPPQAYLPYLVPVLVLRLAQKDIVEEAEELRAALLEQVRHDTRVCREYQGSGRDDTRENKKIKSHSGAHSRVCSSSLYSSSSRR